MAAIQLVRQVGTGQQLELKAMREVQIADTGVEYLSWSLRETYSRHYALVTLVPGTLLTKQMISSVRPELGPSAARVGLALKAGQFPSGLKPGYRVQVIHAPLQGGSAGRYRVLAPSALIDGVEKPVTGGSPGLISVIVDSTVSPAVAAYASSGEIALAELPASR
ncbi:hypothetical protein ABGB17_17375 [Sphaerisporangium sp. B11E5]|uniref:hypothetical protein n=1 Tax=Sphaerisporangium sp. B11E5 TaxID=3153563 RepID=UPI00325D7B66